jgi:tetratricopeptide (TPR) repeat protein
MVIVEAKAKFNIISNVDHQLKGDSMKQIIFSFAVVLIFSSVMNVYGASYPKALMLNEHGLSKESKAELINIIFSKAKDSEKAKAYYLLGSIAFDENKISVALDSWRKLVEKYPKTKEAGLVRDRIKELSEIVGEIEKASIENAVAQSYIRHGDFWSKGKDYKFTIDSSWIPRVEAATKWYEKVIKEFPNSTASRVAYEEKIRTLLGWKDPGQYGERHGIEENFSKYMPQLLKTFNAFEKEHPNASALQAFRYQIAQAYWGNKKWDKTREWLNLIIKKTGGGDSFYKDAAQRRLKKIEY